MNDRKFTVVEISGFALRAYLADSLARIEEREEEWADYEDAEKEYRSHKARYEAQRDHLDIGLDVEEDKVVEKPGPRPKRPTGTHEEEATKEFNNALVVPVELIAQLVKDENQQPMSVDDILKLYDSEIVALQSAILEICPTLKKTMESRKLRIQKALSGL